MSGRHAVESHSGSPKFGKIVHAIPTKSDSSLVAIAAILMWTLDA
jgi:hypothetical protein